MTITTNEAHDAPVTLLMVEFLSWLSNRHRTYDEASEAWRSTCPRHTVWEDAFIDGLVQITMTDRSDQCEVTLTRRGQAVLENAGHAGEH
jgi:hypothetical protein